VERRGPVPADAVVGARLRGGGGIRGWRGWRRATGKPDHGQIRLIENIEWAHAGPGQDVARWGDRVAGLDRGGWERRLLCPLAVDVDAVGADVAADERARHVHCIVVT